MAFQSLRRGLLTTGGTATAAIVGSSWIGDRAGSHVVTKAVEKVVVNRFLQPRQHQCRFFSSKPLSEEISAGSPSLSASLNATEGAASKNISEAAVFASPKSSSFGFMEWYEGYLQASPLPTKMVTGGVLWSIGDAVGQVVPQVASGGDVVNDFVYDWARTGRAGLFGFAVHAPTSHVHFNFLEWLTNRVGVTGLVIPVFKTIMEQVGASYWTFHYSSFYNFSCLVGVFSFETITMELFCDEQSIKNPWNATIHTWAGRAYVVSCDVSQLPMLFSFIFSIFVFSLSTGVGFRIQCIMDLWVWCKGWHQDKSTSALKMFCGTLKRLSGRKWYQERMRREDPCIATTALPWFTFSLFLSFVCLACDVAPHSFGRLQILDPCPTFELPVRSRAASTECCSCY